MKIAASSEVYAHNVEMADAICDRFAFGASLPAAARGEDASYPRTEALAEIDAPTVRFVASTAELRRSESQLHDISGVLNERTMTLRSRSYRAADFPIGEPLPLNPAQQPRDRRRASATHLSVVAALCKPPTPPRTRRQQIIDCF